MSQPADNPLQELEDIGRDDFLEELADQYRNEGYEVIAKDREFPRNTAEQMGVADLVLEDSWSTAYKVVKATKLQETNPSFVDELIEDKNSQTEKARDYFSTNIDPERIHTEVVIGTQGDLHTIRELLENTVGTFTWDQAVDAVSEPARLGNLRDDGEIVLNYEVSREENEEYFELSPELDPVVDALYEHTTYP